MCVDLIVLFTAIFFVYLTMDSHVIIELIERIIILIIK